MKLVGQAELNQEQQLYPTGYTLLSKNQINQKWRNNCCPIK